MITGGWKEAGRYLAGAVRFLRTTSGTTSVAVIGFSDGGRSLVKGDGVVKGPRTIAAGSPP